MYMNRIFKCLTVFFFFLLKYVNICICVFFYVYNYLCFSQKVRRSTSETNTKLVYLNNYKLNHHRLTLTFALFVSVVFNISLTPSLPMSLPSNPDWAAPSIDSSPVVMARKCGYGRGDTVGSRVDSALLLHWQAGC